MFFTNDVLDRLCQAHDNYERLIVNACNGLGQEFVVKGRIATITGREFPELGEDDDEFLIAVVNNGLVLDCGEFDETEENADVEYRTKYSAIMFTDPAPNLKSTFINFFIKNIVSDENRDVIYYNQDYDKIKKFCDKNFWAHYNNQLKKGIVPAILDPDGVQFSQKVGKPMNINGTSGLLYCVDQVLPDGSLKIYHIDFRKLMTTTIDRAHECAVKKGIVTTKAKEIEAERQ